MHSLRVLRVGESPWPDPCLPRTACARGQQRWTCVAVAVIAQGNPPRLPHPPPPAHSGTRLALSRRPPPQTLALNLHPPPLVTCRNNWPVNSSLECSSSGSSIDSSSSSSGDQCSLGGGSGLTHLPPWESTATNVNGRRASSAQRRQPRRGWKLLSAGSPDAVRTRRLLLRARPLIRIASSPARNGPGSWMRRLVPVLRASAHATRLLAASTSPLPCTSLRLTPRPDWWPMLRSRTVPLTRLRHPSRPTRGHGETAPRNREAAISAMISYGGGLEYHSCLTVRTTTMAVGADSSRGPSCYDILHSMPLGRCTFLVAGRSERTAHPLAPLNNGQLRRYALARPTSNRSSHLRMALLPSRWTPRRPRLLAPRSFPRCVWRLGVQLKKALHWHSRNL